VCLAEVGYCWLDLSLIRNAREKGLVAVATYECNGTEQIDIVRRPPFCSCAVCYSLYRTERAVVYDEAIDSRE
jgi:hypothetical protein